VDLASRTVAKLEKDHASIDGPSAHWPQPPDVPADQLGVAGLIMLEARSTCYAGKVDEAVALYQRAIDFKGRFAAKQ